MINTILRNMHTIGAAIGIFLILVAVSHLFLSQLAEYGWRTVN